MVGWNRLLSMEKVSFLEPTLFQLWLTNGTSHTCLPIGIKQEPLPECPLSLIILQESSVHLYQVIPLAPAFSRDSNFSLTEWSCPSAFKPNYFMMWRSHHQYCRSLREEESIL